MVRDEIPTPGFESDYTVKSLVNKIGRVKKTNQICAMCVRTLDAHLNPRYHFGSSHQSDYFSYSRNQRHTRSFDRVCSN